MSDGNGETPRDLTTGQVIAAVICTVLLLAGCFVLALARSGK